MICHMAAGNPLHLHVDPTDVSGAPQRAVYRERTPIMIIMMLLLEMRAVERQVTAPLHVHKANADVEVPAATHKHASEGPRCQFDRRAASAGQYAHSHAE